MLIVGAKKTEIRGEIESFLKETIEFERIEVNLNTLDLRGRGLDGVYLTVLGTSADGADSGQVGRGNRVNGVIPLNRPISSEAAAGKNPVSHVGKIYNTENGFTKHTQSVEDSGYHRCLGFYKHRSTKSYTLRR